MGDFNAMEESPSILYLKGEGELAGAGRSPVPLVDSFRVLHPGAVDVEYFTDDVAKRNDYSRD